MFLHYILHENKTSLINKFLQIQIKNATKRVWGSLINKDIEDLNINLQLEDIEKMSKGAFKKIFKEQIKKHAFIHIQNNRPY